MRFFILLFPSIAFCEVTSIRLTTDSNTQIDRAAVLIIKHQSPAYALTPQGQKEAEERAREFKLEREKQEAEKKERNKQAVQIKNEPSKPPVARPLLVPKSSSHQVIVLPERPKK